MKPCAAASQPGRAGAKNSAAARNEAYDLLTYAVMKRALGPHANCVDVGCHVGSVLRVMLHFCPHGFHHAFHDGPWLKSDDDAVSGLARPNPVLDILRNVSRGLDQRAACSRLKP